MAFNTNKPLVSYIAQSNQTVFDFDFKIFATTDIVILDVDLLQLTSPVDPSEYSVTINGDVGGTITFNTSRTAGHTIVIKRELPIERDVQYYKNGDLKAAELNDDQDYQTYLIADGAVSNEKFYTNDPSTYDVSTTMPIPEANTLLQWDATAKKLVNDDKRYVYSADTTVSPILPTPIIGNSLIWNVDGKSLVNTNLKETLKDVYLHQVNTSISAALPAPKKDTFLGWNAAENALTNIAFAETDAQVDVNYVRTNGLATEGQQDITTYPYSSTNAQVFINGSLLQLNNDYTSYKSTITVTKPMEQGDEYTVLATGIPNEGLPTDYNKQEFTATAGQTAFTVNDTAINIEVYVNGAIYPSSEYSAVGGSVTFNNGLEDGDEVTIISGQISLTTATAAVQYVLGVDDTGAINRITGEQVIQYTYSETPENTTYTIKAKQNAFSIDNLTVNNGSSIVIENEATYKIV